jgi:Tellurite resistance protein TerB.
MFLNELNKKESIAFVNLVEALAQIDDVFAQSEKEMINEYIEDLSLTNETIEKLTFESSVKELSSSTDRVRNIIYFELIGLALADGSYDEKEVKFLNDLAVQFNISTKKQKDFINYFKIVKEVYDSTFVDYENKIESLKKSAMDLL